MSASTTSAPNVQLASETARRSEWSQAWRRFRANRIAVGGLVVILLLVILAIFAPEFSPYDPINDVFRGMRGVGPTADHPFGYDHLGRDLLSRVIFGTRVALLVGLMATGIAVTMGVVIGAVAGYFGSWVDMLISRVIDSLMAFPIIALLLVLAAVLGPSLVTTIVVIGVTGWARFARVVRADVLSLKATDFVTAARAVACATGASSGGICCPTSWGRSSFWPHWASAASLFWSRRSRFWVWASVRRTPSWGRTLADGRDFNPAFSTHIILSWPDDRHHRAGVQLPGGRPARCAGSPRTGLM